jgi:hypothetical protein
MSNIISLTAVRVEKLKQALATYARNGETVILETRTGSITAERINCGDRIAEVLDSFGDYFAIEYGDIRSLRPTAVEQTSVVNARGEFLPVHNPADPTGPVAILPFAKRTRRK